VFSSFLCLILCHISHVFCNIIVMRLCYFYVTFLHISHDILQYKVFSIVLILKQILHWECRIIYRNAFSSFLSFILCHISHVFCNRTTMRLYYFYVTFLSHQLWRFATRGIWNHTNIITNFALRVENNLDRIFCAFLSFLCLILCHTSHVYCNRTAMRLGYFLLQVLSNHLCSFASQLLLSMNAFSRNIPMTQVKT
jgi:hypothetical protein